MAQNKQYTLSQNQAMCFAQMQQSMFIGENQKLLKTYVLSLDSLKKEENVEEVPASTIQYEDIVMIDQEEEVKDKNKSSENNENSVQNHQLQQELNSEIDQESEKESQQENEIVHMNNLVYTKLNLGQRQPEVQKI